VSRRGSFQDDIGNDAWAIAILDHRRQTLPHDRTSLAIRIQLCVGFRCIRVDVCAGAGRL
jgi:hypothetical protein